MQSILEDTGNIYAIKKKRSIELETRLFFLMERMANECGIDIQVE